MFPPKHTLSTKMITIRSIKTINLAPKIIGSSLNKSIPIYLYGNIAPVYSFHPLLTEVERSHIIFIYGYVSE